MRFAHLGSLITAASGLRLLLDPNDHASNVTTQFAAANSTQGDFPPYKDLACHNKTCQKQCWKCTLRDDNPAMQCWAVYIEY